MLKPDRLVAADPKDYAKTVWEPLFKLKAPTTDMTPLSLKDIVSPGSQNLAAGQQINAEVKGNFKVQRLLVDIAPDVDADVYLDGTLRFSTRDRQGLGGQFELGDLSGKSYFPLQSVRIVATNQHASASRDVRAWMVTL